MEIKTSIKYDKLKKLVQSMAKNYSVKVGLLSNKGGADEVGANIDYAGLGAVHEFGCDIKITEKMAAYLALTAKELGLPELHKKGDGYIHIPARSFLQMPLTRKNAILKKLKQKKIFHSQDEFIWYFGKTGDMMTLATLLGANAVEVVQEAFATSGYGEWKPDSPYTIAAKGSEMPLLDTGELRKKITYEIEEK